MKPVIKDIVVSKEILNLFKNSVRIIDKKHLAGMWPVDIRQLQKLQTLLPKLFMEENIMKRYDIAIAYNGKTIQKDFPKIGLVHIDERIIIPIHTQGIIVPWQLLRKAGIDHKKFNIVLTPKQ